MAGAFDAPRNISPERSLTVLGFVPTTLGSVIRDLESWILVILAMLAKTLEARVTREGYGQTLEGVLEAMVRRDRESD